MLFGSRTKVTGLDIGSTSVKAATLRHGADGATLVGLALAEIQPSEDREKAVADAVKLALEKGGAAKTSPVVTAVAGPGVSVKHVTFPEMPRQALAESIRWEARKHVPFEGSDFVLDFQPLEGANGGEGNGELQVLLAAVETRLLDEHVGLLGSVGVEPDAVDIAPLALMNELDEEGLLNGEALAAIDLGVQAITVAVYRRGGLFFARSIPLVAASGGRTKRGEGDEDDQGDQREPTAARAGEGETKRATSPARSDDSWMKIMLRELRRSLTFYNNETGKQGIDRIYLTGGRALTPGIDRRLQSDLGVATEILNPLANLTDVGVNLETLDEQGPRFALALGLARRQ
ncbi:MAG: type IV pilus assembly protein PilM [Candidatus Eisenbacteria bacterium]|nr:type IV pilus assembly protein PilM [Candidatus Eisenbacteria bacterium]